MPKPTRVEVNIDRLYGNNILGNTIDGYYCYRQEKLISNMNTYTFIIPKNPIKSPEEFIHYVNLYIGHIDSYKLL